MQQETQMTPRLLDRTGVAPRVGRMEQLASIRRLTAEDGKGRGMRVWEVNNGSGLAFTIYPDRGLDIGQVYIKGLPVAWVSANREVAPHFYEPAGAGWLRSWGGGLLTGCGLANVGSPATANGEALGLHGRLSHTPAEEVNATAGWNAAGQYALEISGVVAETRVFGEKLRLTRHITTALGDNSITVRDTVENAGFAPAPCMLLYHINLGWPLVDAGARLEAAPHRVVPRDARAAEGIEEWMTILPPTPDFAEQVFYHEIPAGSDGLATMRLRNGAREVSVSYRVAELPWLVQWRMLGQGEYVTGLEPANALPEGQATLAERGLLRRLAPGETFETFVRIALV
jgi:hypothetical protein